MQKNKRKRKIRLVIIEKAKVQIVRVSQETKRKRKQEAAGLCCHACAYCWMSSPGKPLVELNSRFCLLCCSDAVLPRLMQAALPSATSTATITFETHRSSENGTSGSTTAQYNPRNSFHLATQHKKQPKTTKSSSILIATRHRRALWSPVKWSLLATRLKRRRGSPQQQQRQRRRFCLSCQAR